MDNFFELKNLEEFYSQNPDSIIFAFLAQEYIKRGDYHKARETVEKGLRKYPSYAFGHYITGLSYYHLNDLKKAQKHLEISIRLDEKNPRAWKLIGEINENLEISVPVAESNLQYFLLDSFNKDAVDNFQKEEMLQFDEFEDDQSPEFEGELSGEETFPKREKEFGLLEDDTDIEALFETEEQPEELNISQKVDEVFKETLGDMSIEREETPSEEDIFEDTLKEIEFMETVPDKKKESPPPEKKAESEEIDFGLDLDFDDFYSEPGVDESASGEELPEAQTGKPKEKDPFSFEEEEFDFSSILFEDTEASEELKLGAAMEEEPGEKTEGADFDLKEEDEPQAASEEPLFEEPVKEENNSDELLNYQSMVDEILSEKEEETAPEKEDQAGEGTVLKLKEMEILPEEPETLPEPLVEAKPVPPPPTPSRSDGTTRFGKPPILSPTLGEIYISQGRFEEALDVFQQLLDKDPENQRFQKKIKDIQGMLDRQKSL